MKTVIISTILISAILLQSQPVNAATIFNDSFETGLGNWTLIQPNNQTGLNIVPGGYYTPNRIDFNFTSTPIILEKQFSQQSKVIAQVYFYDQLNNTQGTKLYLGNNTYGVNLGVNTNEFANSYFISTDASQNQFIDTKVTRTQGWHLFQLVTTPGGTYAKVDGQFIDTKLPSMQNATKAHLAST